MWNKNKKKCEHRLASFCSYTHRHTGWRDEGKLFLHQFQIKMVRSEIHILFMHHLWWESYEVSHSNRQLSVLLSGSSQCHSPWCYMEWFIQTELGTEVQRNFRRAYHRVPPSEPLLICACVNSLESCDMCCTRNVRMWLTKTWNEYTKCLTVHESLHAIFFMFVSCIYYSSVLKVVTCSP
jgi:hypothetical protein